MKTKVNKSEKVRQYISAHPDHGPKAVAEAMKAKGIKITAGHVSVIKFNMNKKKPVKAKAKAEAPVKTKAEAPVKTKAEAPVKTLISAEITKQSDAGLVDAIMQARHLVGFAGGLDKAKSFLDLVSRL